VRGEGGSVVFRREVTWGGAEELYRRAGERGVRNVAEGVDSLYGTVWEVDGGTLVAPSSSEGACELRKKE